ncbi:MAG: hypothetical protein AB7G28_26050 [Pirellulales bacterium]
MARQEHILSVFVASPSDVSAERTKLEEVIRELNETWSRTLGIRIELLKWETHAYPGMGEDAQAVINQQLPNDFDIFIGIMWCRFGTPTGRAGSGTLEEFERAKKRHDESEGAVKIMIYFKDEAVAPSKVDIQQLSQLLQFRDSLGEMGSLYWTFSNIDHFEKLVRMHLARQVQAWKDSQAKPAPDLPTIEIRANEEKAPTISDDDLGVLDYMELFEDAFSDLTNIAQRLSEAMEDIAAKIGERTAELDKLPRDAKGNANTRDAKRLISRAATDMDQFSARIEADIPYFNNSFNTGMNALMNAVMLSVEMNSDSVRSKDIEDGLTALATLRTVLESIESSSTGFKDTVRELPRMTGELNKAKRKVVGSLESLNQEFAQARTLVIEAEKNLRELLDG